MLGRRLDRERKRERERERGRVGRIFTRANAAMNKKRKDSSTRQVRSQPYRHLYRSNNRWWMSSQCPCFPSIFSPSHLKKQNKTKNKFFFAFFSCFVPLSFFSSFCPIFLNMFLSLFIDHLWRKTKAVTHINGLRLPWQRHYSTSTTLAVYQWKFIVIHIHIYVCVCRAFND